MSVRALQGACCHFPTLGIWGKLWVPRPPVHGLPCHPDSNSALSPGMEAPGADQSPLDPSWLVQARLPCLGPSHMAETLLWNNSFVPMHTSVSLMSSVAGCPIFSPASPRS